MALASSPSGKIRNTKSDHVHLENPRDKYKSILQRTGKFQNFFNELWQLISNYTVKAACVRDKNDDIARCLNNFSKVEGFSTSSKLAMVVSAELLASVGDYEDLGVQRMETLVLPNLSSYGMICDSVKADIWKAIQSIKRAVNRKNSVNNLRRKTNSNDPKLKQVLDDAIREYERASAESARLCQLSQEHVIKFEHKRLMDLKETLGNFVKIQIAIHAKSLELLSQTYKHIQSIDEDADLDILKSSLKINDSKFSKKGPKKSDSRKSRSKRKDTKRSSKTRVESDENNNSSECRSSGDSEDDNDASFSDEIQRLEDALTPKHKTSRSREKLVENISKTHNHNHHNMENFREKSSEKNISRSKSLEKEKSRKEDRPKSSKSNNADFRGKIRHQEDFSAGDADGDYFTRFMMASSKRPTSPPRPLRFSPRLNDDNDKDFTFRNRNFKSASSVDKNNTHHQSSSYYYSQSEDETEHPPTTTRYDHHPYHHLNYGSPYDYQRSLAGGGGKGGNSTRQAFVSTTTSGRRVSFQNNAEQQQQHSAESFGNTNPYYSSNNQNQSRSDHQSLFPPVKSSLKRYC